MTTMTMPADAKLAEFVYIRHCYSDDGKGNLRSICGKTGFSYPRGLDARSVNAVACKDCYHWFVVLPEEQHYCGRVDSELNSYHRTRQAAGLR